MIYTIPVHLVAIGKMHRCNSCFFQMIPLVERANTLHIHPITVIVSKIVGLMFVDVNGKKHVGSNTWVEFSSKNTNRKQEIRSTYTPRFLDQIHQNVIFGKNLIPAPQSSSILSHLLTTLTLNVNFTITFSL